MSDLPLKVLGDRVLIQPDVEDRAPAQTASGIYMAASLTAAVTGADAATSVCRGTVIAVGRPRHPLAHEAEALAHRLERRAHSAHSLEADTAQFIRDLVARQPAVAVGDDVLFNYDVGQRVDLDATAYLILREADLLAVVTPEGEETHERRTPAHTAA